MMSYYYMVSFPLLYYGPDLKAIKASGTLTKSGLWIMPIVGKNGDVMGLPLWSKGLSLSPVHGYCKAVYCCGNYGGGNRPLIFGKGTKLSVTPSKWFCLSF